MSTQPMPPVRMRIPGALQRLRRASGGSSMLGSRWWQPIAGLAMVGAVFFTMPQWMPAVGFLSVGDGVIVAIDTILALGMVLVLGYCGQLMLATNALFGVGAFGMAILALHDGLDPWAGMAVSAVVVGVGALLIGLMVFRLTGHLLGMVTLAIGYIAFIVFDTSSLTGGGAGGISAGASLAIGGVVFTGASTSFFYLCAAAALLGLLVARNLVVSRTGRALRAVESSEAAAAASGVNATHYKVVAFVVSAMMASVAGSLYANYIGVVGSSSFTILLTVEVLLMAVVGGLRSVWGAPFGVLAVVMFQEALQKYGPDVIHVSPSYFTTVGFGIVLIIVLLLVPGGLSSVGLWVRRVVPISWESSKTQEAGGVAQADPTLSRLLDASAPAGITLAGSDARRKDDRGARGRSPTRSEASERSPVLVATGITCRFAGLLALDDVTIELQPGEILGLIGPNGAGKTTLFNCLSGHVKPSSGTVRVGGADVTGMAPHRIARHGLVRTFQNIELFPEMSVLENVMVGAHLLGRSGAGSAILRLPRYWRDERELAARARGALERVAMGHHVTRAAGELSYGQQRRVEIARALAGSPRVLLLDEPAAGLSATEAEELVDLVRELAAQSLGIVLVEHNMRALMSVADRVTALAFGRQLVTAPPDEIRRHPSVITSYLGTGLGTNHRQEARVASSSTSPGSPPDDRRSGGAQLEGEGK